MAIYRKFGNARDATIVKINTTGDMYYVALTLSAESLLFAITHTGDLKECILNPPKT